MTTEQAIEKLRRYSKTDPEVKLTIKNFHYEKRAPGASVGRPLPAEGVWADRLDQEELREIQEQQSELRKQLKAEKKGSKEGEVLQKESKLLDNEEKFLLHKIRQREKEREFD